MSTQPKALRLAADLNWHSPGIVGSEAAAELRRLHFAREECERQYQAKCDEIGALHEMNQELLEVLRINLEVLEKVDPYKGQEELLIDVVLMNKEVITKATGEQT